MASTHLRGGKLLYVRNVSIMTIEQQFREADLVQGILDGLKKQFPGVKVKQVGTFPRKTYRLTFPTIEAALAAEKWIDESD